MPSGHHDCKKVARQIKTGYCFKKIKAGRDLGKASGPRSGGGEAVSGKEKDKVMGQ
jgi:hypothetical protein